MPAPSVETVLDYLGSHSSWGPTDIASALAAEKANQAALCAVPADDAAWPADLAEALCRRVSANLAVRKLPLGIQASMTEMAVSTTRVGGYDREVERLEAPYRRIAIA